MLCVPPMCAGGKYETSSSTSSSHYTESQRSARCHNYAVPRTQGSGLGAHEGHSAKKSLFDPFADLDECTPCASEQLSMSSLTSANAEATLSSELAVIESCPVLLSSQSLRKRAEERILPQNTLLARSPQAPRGKVTRAFLERVRWDVSRNYEANRSESYSVPVLSCSRLIFSPLVPTSRARALAGTCTSALGPWLRA